MFFTIYGRRPPWEVSEDLGGLLRPPETSGSSPGEERYPPSSVHRPTLGPKTSKILLNLSKTFDDGGGGGGGSGGGGDDDDEDDEDDGDDGDDGGGGGDDDDSRRLTTDDDDDRRPMRTLCKEITQRY